MLQTQTVDGATLGLLKDLMAMPELKPFALVGDTNLSLKKVTWKQVKTKMQTAVKKYLERNKI